MHLTALTAILALGAFHRSNAISLPNGGDVGYHKMRSGRNGHSNKSSLAYPVYNATRPADTEVSISALGINCRGSSYCSFNYVARFDLKNFGSYTNPELVRFCPITAQREWRDGEMIYCDRVQSLVGPDHRSFCLFAQYMPPGSSLKLHQVHELVGRMLDHGCTACGSVPISALDGSNDPESRGILTVNHVADPGCDGWCLDGQGATAENITNLGAQTDDSQV